MATIDQLAGTVDALRRRLEGDEAIPSRELRAIWRQRLKPFWRLHVELYRALSHRFLDLGDNYLATEVADEASQFFGDDVALILTRALAAARTGAAQAAQDLLARKQSILANAVEAGSLLARTFKDLWKSSGDVRYLRESFDLYYLDYTTTKDDRTFPGVNAASMALFLGRVDDAKRIAREVLALSRGRPEAAGYWDRVTVAECLLVDGQIEAARQAYAAAAGGAGVPPAHLATTRAQARLLLRQLGGDAAEFDPCFPLPAVIAFSGHRLDTPDRAAPRFPESLAPAIKERIREVIRRRGAGYGYAAAANGADILFLEVMQEMGLETYVHLPLPEDDFIRKSVEHPGSPEWLERYRAVTAKATEFTCPTHVRSLAFDYSNQLLYGAACQRAQFLGSEVCLLAVWNGLPGDGAGGTADYIQMVRDLGRPVEIIPLPAVAGPEAVRPPVAAESADRLISILALSLSAEEQGRSFLAGLAPEKGVVHRETFGASVRLFFETPAAAVPVAIRIAREMGGALGLHVGEVRFAPHPLTGDRVARGEDLLKAGELAALEPAGTIFASHEFAAMLGLHPVAGVRCEFLGYRALPPRTRREPIFQLQS